MKKYLKLKCSLIAISCLLLQTQVWADPIVEAINAASASITQTINAARASSESWFKTLQTQMGANLDNIFISRTVNNASTYGLLDTKVKNFYAPWAFPPTTTSGYITNFPTTSFTDTTELTNYNSNTENQVRNFQSKNIGYNMQYSSLDRQKGTDALAAQNIESDLNNLDPTTLNFDSPDQAYGFLYNNTPTSDKTPCFNDLIGVDNYNTQLITGQDTLSQAKLFIAYLLQASPPSPSIYLPPKSGKDILVYLPYFNKKKNLPYTMRSITNDTSNTNYTRAVNFLQKNKLFQEYKIKTRTTNILRTIYIEPLLRAYQERIANPGMKSLVEKEKAASLEGMGTDYYNNLKTKSLADVNLETLKALNKQVYFLYKIHKDNEKIALILSAAALQQGGLSSVQDETKYLKPIGNLIKNRCWDTTSSDYSNRKAACENPPSTDED